MVSDAPIGVFDSGIGGLTVARAIMRALPHEALIYVGDTARVPYGPKSPDTVIRYSRQIAAHLVAEGAKVVVVACNTATAHALPVLQAEWPVPVLGVIQPGANAAVAATRTGAIGVIGTTGTVGSGAYPRAIAALDPDATVLQQACPLFVPLVEEGWTDHPAARLIAAEYLAPLRAAAVDTLVLGCTHYPLLQPVIADVMGDGVTIVDAAAETARRLVEVLSHAALRRSAAGDPPRHRFIATDAPEAFLRVGQRFLGASLDRVETTLFA